MAKSQKISSEKEKQLKREKQIEETVDTVFDSYFVGLSVFEAEQVLAQLHSKVNSHAVVSDKYASYGEGYEDDIPLDDPDDYPQF